MSDRYDEMAGTLAVTIDDWVFGHTMNESQYKLLVECLAPALRDAAKVAAIQGRVGYEAVGCKGPNAVVLECRMCRSQLVVSRERYEKGEFDFPPTTGNSGDQ